MNVSASIDIAAPADVVWALVSDLTRMGEWSPETTKVEWKGGAKEAALGVSFKGHNKAGSKGWSTDGKIVTFEPGREIAWDVTAVGVVKVARWRYVVEPTEDGHCRLTESTEDQRNGIAKKLGAIASGVTDRDAHNRKGIEATLERIKEVAEFAP